MTTKRMPRKRMARHRITPAAIAAYRAMQATRDGSEAWWNAHWALHCELGLPPWILPFDGSEDELIWPLDSPVTTGELWRELERASKPFRAKGAPTSRSRS